MVSYNTGPVLFRAVEAVLREPEVKEILLVDNGNTREVRARLKALSETEPRFIFITGHGNVGFATACNLGAARATGHYLVLLNPDCIVPSAAFSRMLTAMEAHPEAWLAGCRILNADGSEQPGSRRNLLTPAVAFVENFRLYRLLPRRRGRQSYFKRMNFHEEEEVEKPTYVPAISGAFMMMERERYYTIGGLDEEYFFHVEDLDFCYQVHKKGGKILFVPNVAPVHYRSTSQVSSMFVEFCKARGFIRYFDKHFSGRYFPGFLTLMKAAIYLRFALRALVVAIQAPLKMPLLKAEATRAKLRTQWLNTEVDEKLLVLSGLVRREGLEPVLLVGATGQVGLSILRRLLHARMKVIATFHDTVMDYAHPDLTWIYGNMEGATLDLRGMPAATVIYTPGIWTLPPHLKRLKRSGVKRLICFSSTSIIAKATSGNAYEKELVSKFSEAEQEVTDICKELGIEFTILRPTMIYGIGLDRNVSSIVRFLKTFRVFPIVPPGEGQRQPVHVDDLARAVLLMLDIERTYGKRYNLGGAERLTYKALVERLCETIRMPARFIPMPFLPKALDTLSQILRKPDLNGEIAKRMNQHLVFGFEEATADFGYTPRPFLTAGKADLGLAPHKPKESA